MSVRPNEATSAEGVHSMKATSDDLRHAYRLLLGREPDASGFAWLAKHIEQTNAVAPDVASMFFKSDEFKRRAND